jgi:hypothetical protein
MMIGCLKIILNRDVGTASICSVCMRLDEHVCEENS